MKTNNTPFYSFLLVLLLHVGVLAVVLLVPAESESLEIVPPTIQGVIVAAQPPVPPLAALPPPPIPEQKPLPKPKMLVPKAPPSERAVQQDVTPVVVAPVEQKTDELSVMQSPEQLVPPRIDASQANNPAPVYPAVSRRLREQGVVLLEVLVLADGSVGELRVKQSSGHARLDETAIRAVKNWHFVAATRANQAIDFWYELPIEFSLNN
ncbi:MAG: energy transducer TonB [Pseudomonadota bacterium]